MLSRAGEPKTTVTLKRSIAASSFSGSASAFKLDKDDCYALQQEGIQFYYRYLCFFQLGDYKRAERDTARNLRMFDFVKRHASDKNNIEEFEQYRPYVMMMNTRSKVLNVIALLAVIFFLRPLLDGFETVTVKYLGFQIQLNFIYYSITGCLALAAYLYALEAVAGTPVRLVQQLGNAAYALAILMPPAYVGLLVLHLGNHFLTVKMMAPDSARLAWQIGLTVLVVAAGYFPFRLLRRRLRDEEPRP